MNHARTLLVLSAIVTIGGLTAYGVSIWPRQATAGTTTLPTQAISEEQGVGGVAVKSAQPKTSPSTDQPETTDSERKYQENTQPTTINVAPKQTEIKQSTPFEYEYRALRTTNDPLPQPAWSMSATKTQTAWDTATGNGVVVAVIDSGFALAHEDLMNQWYQNTAETGMTALGGRCWTGVSVSKTTNNCDDDNNGYVDDWKGWDFDGIDNYPQAGQSNPTGQGVAHGTEVAGLVGATGNNGVGTVSVAWNNSIMPLQALSDDGSGYTSDITAAVYYAVDNGASVINMSLGGSSNDPTLAQAIKYAYDRDVVVVAAAGNCGTGAESGCDPTKPGAMGYPALNPYVIAVGATTNTNVRASFSSYGPGLDVTAPGSGTLVSPMWQSGNQTSAYATSLYGTSFASPIVASYVGLLKSIRPASTVDDITALVDATASKTSAMGADQYSNTMGHGIIDSEAGLRAAGRLNLTTGTPELLQAGDNISEHTFKSTSTLASGCKATAGNYCTIWARNAAGYDRYLPYIATNGNGQAGWTWTGNWLGTGDWSLRSRSGSTPSTTPYQLFNK